MIAFIFSAYMLPVSIGIDFVSESWKIVALFGVVLIIACHFTTFFMRIQIFERGFILRNYQTWIWKKEHVRSYEVIDGIWEKFFIFPGNDLILVGITEKGEKRRIIRRGNYPIFHDVFDEIHDKLTESVSNIEANENSEKEEFDIIMRFSNSPLITECFVPLFLWLVCIILAYSFIASFSIISILILFLMISSLFWSYISFTDLALPWDSERTYMISNNRVRIFPNSSKEIVTDVDFNKITKVELKTSFFSHHLKVHLQEDCKDLTVGLFVLKIDSEQIEKLFKELMKRIPSEIVTISQ